MDTSDTFIMQEEALRRRFQVEGFCEAVTARFRELVLSRFAAQGRLLPWRFCGDPYAVLVSEVMLQQTQAPRVAQYFPRFMAVFPTVEALAAAPLSAVLGQWQGLGYNRRAAFLHRAAREVMDRHGGVLPDTEEGLRRLPGIGPATAASIAAFAFGRPSVFLETNIRSVFIHLFFAGRDRVEDRELLPLVAASLEVTDPARWYNALMDYGAWVKARVGNPSRRSAGHHAQSRFEGSRRQLRGRVLALLLDNGPLETGRLAVLLGNDPRLNEVLDALHQEGMIRRAGRRVSLA